MKGLQGKVFGIVFCALLVLVSTSYAQKKGSLEDDDNNKNQVGVKTQGGSNRLRGTCSCRDMEGIFQTGISEFFCLINSISKSTKTCEFI